MSDRLLVRPGECCLHIIDPQKSLMAQIHEADRVERVIGFLVECLRILEVPIIASTQYVKGLGPYVDSLEEKVERYSIPRRDKVEFSAYRNADTLSMLQETAEKVSTVILVGVETHICIYQSAAALLSQGITPWIVADGVSSRSAENHQFGLERLSRMGAKVGPAEMILYELLGKAGTPQFKAILPHVIAFDRER